MTRGTAVRLGVLGLIWGSSFLLIKEAVAGMAPLQLTLIRLAAGAVTLLAIAWVRNVPLPRDPVLWRHLAVLGVLSNLVPFTLFAYGEQRIPSGLAGVLNGTTPLFTLLTLVVAGGGVERLTRSRTAGLGIGFLGTLLVVAPWRAGSLGGSVAGQLACLLAAACYGAAFVYARRFVTPSGLSPLALAAAQLTCATFTLVLAAPLLTRGTISAAPSVLGSALVLGVLMTGLAYLLNYRLIADAGATTASMVTYLIPVVAVLLGAVVLAEPLGWNVPAGGAVVVAGVAVAEGRLGRRRTAAQARFAEAVR